MPKSKRIDKPTEIAIINIANRLNRAAEKSGLNVTLQEVKNFCNLSKPAISKILKANGIKLQKHELGNLNK